MKLANGNWRIASRDIFRGYKCTHCTVLSMAVAAGQEDILEKVKPFEEDLSMKLPIIQGNIWERQLFSELTESIGESFVELHSFDMTDTIDQIKLGTPVIAQGYMTKMLGNVMWSGLVDLLIRDDYQFVYVDEKLSAIQKDSGDPSKYAVFDIKHSGKAKDSYRLQVASYHEVLVELGYAGGDPGLVIKGFEIPTFDATKVLAELEAARKPLLDILNSHNPADPFDKGSMQWHCTKPATCMDVYCDYPKQCKNEFLAEDHLFQLPTKFHTHLFSLRDAGYGSVESLLELDPETEIPGLKQHFVHHYTRWAAIVHKEKTSGKPFYSQIAKPTEVGLPELSQGDLFFDIEWFNPVGNVDDLNFMWGVVDSNAHFESFLGDDYDEEKRAFEKFIEFSIAKLESDPNMHIFHYHNPEPLRMKKLSERYDYLHQEVDLLLPTMVDLKKVAEKSIEPGSGSYSIKKLERYYEADNKLNRTGLVAAGADALLQYHLYLESKKLGEESQAQQIMQLILDYNEDDCLSTKLLAEWLHTIS